MTKISRGGIFVQSGGILVFRPEGIYQASPIGEGGGYYPPTPLPRASDPPRWRRAKRAAIFFGFFRVFSRLIMIRNWI